MSETLDPVAMELDQRQLARTQRVRNHLQRPDHPDRQLTNAKVGSTVNRTDPSDLR
jgi:hypothetical protein